MAQQQAHSPANGKQSPGLRKAAMFLLSLGQDAGPIVSRLHEDEVRDISHAMSELGIVPAEEVHRVLAEFADRLSNSNAIMGSVDQTQRSLSAFLPPDKVAEVLQEISGPAGRSIWEKLGNVNEATLAGYLCHEYPQTASVVLSKLAPSRAAAVLRELPEEFAYECIQRMIAMDPVNREVLEQVEETLRVEFMSNLGKTLRRDSHEMLAEVFNHLDRQSEKRLSEFLAVHNRESAERIKALMFVFEDLKGLDGPGVQTLMRSIDKVDLATAMKGASETLRDLLLANMSQRAAKLLTDEMSGMGPVRLKDVEAAQARIVATSKDLAERGEITMPGGDTGDELIY